MFSARCLLGATEVQPRAEKAKAEAKAKARLRAADFRPRAAFLKKAAIGRKELSGELSWELWGELSGAMGTS
jgi:glycine cleavage system aminomethyltransferase T